MSSQSASLAGKVALVTGASRGIGRAIAERLARDGAAVAVNYRSHRVEAEAVMEAVRASGGTASALHADLSRLSEVRRLFEETAETFGRLDILVNNAATAWFGPIAEVTEERFDELFALNVKSVFFCLQEAARRLADGGRIVNVSSGITIAGGSGAALYAGSKGAVEQFTQSLAKELAPRGITVNAVLPGPTETDMLQSVPPAQRAGMADLSPFRRLGQPADIADVVAFLVSEEARWLTACLVRVNGGAN